VLNVTAVAPTAGEARERAYRAIERVDFPGVQYRHDIALGEVHART
jgi:phosphoribosylamine-glycine ligase